jgi:hypothetical protein
MESCARSVIFGIPNLLDPRFDQDSCGVGFVAQLSGEPSHAILEHALTALARLEHRGAVAADGKSSDGVGVMTAIPRDLLLLPLGIELDHDKPLGVAVVFLEGESLASRAELESAFRRAADQLAGLASGADLSADSGFDRGFDAAQYLACAGYHRRFHRLRSPPLSGSQAV